MGRRRMMRLLVRVEGGEKMGRENRGIEMEFEEV
jgi:hypothetical protein